MIPPTITEERVHEIVREELARALPELLDTKVVADRLAVSRWQVYKLLDQQAMESVRSAASGSRRPSRFGLT